MQTNVRKIYNCGWFGVVALAAWLQGCDPRRSPDDASAREVASPAPPSADASDRVPKYGGESRLAALPDFTALVANVGNAVVNVTAVTQAAARADRGEPDSESFYDFFRRFGIPQPEGQPPARGMGSGFIVSSDGYILTNAHVVNGATEVTVKLTDRRELSAKIVGVDTRSDVAVLKVDTKSLPIVKLGDASRLRPGEWVVAIGSPFGFENSVTAGVVSGTARSLQGDGYVPFIQTDVAVNPGNSGGPLFNLQGEVIGINSQIYSRSGGYMGLSFAVPIDVARDVQQQLVKTGRVERGRLGVSIQDVNAQLAESFGLDRARGALVSSVEAGGPADQAGVKPGDVILQVGKQVVEHSNELPSRIAAIKPGEAISLGVWRDGAVVQLQVRVGQVQESVARLDRAPTDMERSRVLGLSVRPLTLAERASLGTQGSLLVVEVSGKAAVAGIEPGDVVLSVNRRPVRSIGELRDAIAKAGRNAALLIQRGDAQTFVPIPLESAG